MDRKAKTYVLVPEGHKVAQSDGSISVVSKGKVQVSRDEIFMTKSDFEKLSNLNLEKLPFPFEHSVSRT
jgi:hypothetical protein